MNHACCFLKISFPRVFYSLIIVCLRVSVLLFTQFASCWAFWIYGFISFISFVNSAWSIQIASFLHFLCLSYLQFSSDLCGTPLCPPCLNVFVLFISLSSSVDGLWVISSDQPFRSTILFFFSCDLSVVNMSLFFSLSFKIYIYIFYSFKIWNNFHFKIIIESSVAKIVQRVHEYLCSAFPNGDLLNN